MVRVHIGIKTVLIFCFVCKYAGQHKSVFADDKPKPNEVYQFDVEHTEHENPSHFHTIRQSECEPSALAAGLEVGRFKFLMSSRC